MNEVTVRVLRQCRVDQTRSNGPGSIVYSPAVFKDVEDGRPIFRSHIRKGVLERWGDLLMVRVAGWDGDIRLEPLEKSIWLVSERAAKTYLAHAMLDLVEELTAASRTLLEEIKEEGGHGS